jgi:hypothetical protein
MIDGVEKLANFGELQLKDIETINGYQDVPHFHAIG